MCVRMLNWGEVCDTGGRGWGGALTPLVEILVPRVGRLMPFLCALKFWLWLVWFFDLAMSACFGDSAGGGGRTNRGQRKRCELEKASLVAILPNLLPGTAQ